ncbi:hypothetical protein HK100_007435 [Physocladia obscura]|uniref:Uncharacterized protein n=1 Tax=Physocladia obscura TaxID=109957 RepID=A0AAD5SRP4_9FUNG|nr:hypothetical protein HK100_007435 [Physocladia obscura]
MDEVEIPIPDKRASARDPSETWQTYKAKIFALLHVCDSAIQVATGPNKLRYEGIKKQLTQKKREKQNFDAEKQLEAEKAEKYLAETHRRDIIRMVGDGFNSNKNLAEVLAREASASYSVPISQKRKHGDTNSSSSSPKSPPIRNRVVSEIGSSSEWKTRLSTLSSDEENSNGGHQEELKPYVRESMKPVDQAASLNTAKASFELAVKGFMESNHLTGRTNEFSDDIYEC